MDARIYGNSFLISFGGVTMSKINQDQVKQLAHAVRIEISDEEATKYAEEISQLLTQADKMDEVDTKEVRHTTHGVVKELGKVLRQAKPVQSITQEEALKNAPDKQDGHFKVPAIME